MLEYFPRKIGNSDWIDIAFDGKKVGYIHQENDFYAVTLYGDFNHSESYTTLERAKQEVHNEIGEKLFQDVVTALDEVLEELFEQMEA